MSEKHAPSDRNNEEGYAEFERGLYITEALGRSNGFGGEKLTDKHVKAFIPSSALLRKYAFALRMEGKEEIGLLGGALQAVVLELLIQRDPLLFGALRRARHSVEGLREVAWRIDRVCPGLYGEMRQIENVNAPSPETSQRVTRLVTKVMNLVS